MKCTVIFVFGDARPNHAVISQFSKAYYSKGIHVNVLKLCVLTNIEVVFLVIRVIS